MTSIFTFTKVNMDRSSVDTNKHTHISLIVNTNITSGWNNCLFYHWSWHNFYIISYKHQISLTSVPSAVHTSLYISWLLISVRHKTHLVAIKYICILYYIREYYNDKNRTTFDPIKCIIIFSKLIQSECTLFSASTSKRIH